MENALSIMDKIPGWLLRPAAAFTYELIKLQLGSVGPIVEIGVYRGKYLSVLRAAVSDTTKIVGYDLYPHNQENVILRTFKNNFGSVDNIILIKADSTKLDASDIIRDCSVRPSFISVDGSHEASPVESDMHLATEALAEHGVVALDDFLNPYTVGVNEGFYRYIFNSNKETLVPFAFVTNKLFLARQTYVEKYLEYSRSFLLTNIDKPYMARMKKRLEEKAHTETNLLSRKVVTITL